VTTFAEQIAAALDIDDAVAAGERVHRVVMDEIVDLDPSVKPTATGYFNHSYVPDLVVEWKEGSKTASRPIYLRHSLRSSRASGDLENLAHADKSGLFLSLSPEEPEDETRLARRAVEINAQSRTLITTVPAIDELSKPVGAPDPVLGIVKASVVRSAKGFFVEDDVEKLVLPRDRRIEGADLEAFSSTVAASFSEEAVFKINRVVRIVEQALSDNPDAGQILESGSLSQSEIRELVPYLLGLDGVTQSRDFWLSVARLISLEEIERQWGTFAELDLTPLASAGSSVWRATRAQLALRADSIDDDDFDMTPKWAVTGRTLSAEVGNWLLTFAYAGTKIKTAGRASTPARWTDLQAALAGYTVTAVDLSGVVTQSAYGAVEAADMKSRVDAFIEGADDSFHIPSVTVATGAGDDAAVLKADFTEMMVLATPSTTVDNLTKVALNVLGYRYPTDVKDVHELLTAVRTDDVDATDDAGPERD
jgi:hypothetical protein